MHTTQASHTLSARGLKPLAVIAQTREHGDRIRYLAGCRCTQCRAANAAYAKSRKIAQQAGDWNGLVSAERARQHLVALSEKGIGRRSVSRACDVAEPIIGQILNGRKARIRARTERTILKVTEGAASDRSLVAAAPAWALINELLASGYAKCQLAAALGMKTGALQLGKSRITARNDYEVRKMHERLRHVSAARAQRQLLQLAQEGYTPNQVRQRAEELANTIGEPVPELKIGTATVSQATARFIAKLHTLMTA